MLFKNNKSILLVCFIFLGCTTEKSGPFDIPSEILEMENITIYSPEEIAKTDTVRLINEVSFGDTDDLFIGRILGFQVDKNSRVYINDGAHEARTIHVYEPDGTYIKSLGDYGEGPGEFRSPGILRLYSDKLYVYDFELNRLTSYSIHSLELLETYQFDPNMIEGAEAIKGMRLSDYYVLNENTLIVGFKRPQKYFEEKPGSYHYFKTDIAFNKLGKEVFDQLAVLEAWGEFNGMRIMKMFPFFEKPMRTVSASGRIFTANSSDFLIKEHSLEGNIIGGFYYPSKKESVTRSDALSASNMMTREIARNTDLPQSWPVLTSFFTDDDERIWVSTFTKNDHEIQWWILQPSGELIARFVLPGNRYSDPRISNNIINMAHNGYFYSRETNDETGTERVVKYRIQIGGN